MLAWVGYAALLALATALFVDTALLAAAHLGHGAAGRAREAASPARGDRGRAARDRPLLLLAVRQGGQVDWIVRFGSPPLWTDGIEQQWFRSEPVMIGWAAVLVVGLAVARCAGGCPLAALAVAAPWAVLPPVLLVVGRARARAASTGRGT